MSAMDQMRGFLDAEEVGEIVAWGCRPLKW